MGHGAVLLAGSISGHNFAGREVGSFVCAGTPARRHGDIEQTQVDAQLAAMLVHVAEHDVAEKVGAGLLHHDAITELENPGFFHCSVAEAGQKAAHGCSVLVKGRQNFVERCRLRKIEFARSLCGIVLDEMQDSRRHAGDVKRQLPSGQGLLREASR